ncbi:MAG TPA: hypothetical protein VM573_03490 [Actinomycetota bacterium]|jgi:hypothetical protein|nr:hypothetical protein [Actinomycetota bacterium]
MRKRATAVGMVLLMALVGCRGQGDNEGEGEGGYDPRPGIIETPLDEQN